MKCPFNEQEVYDFCVDKSEGRVNAEMQSHIEGCEKCRKTVDDFRHISRAVEAMGHMTLTPGGESNQEVELPSTIGDFKVLGLIAEGGMGRVYKGFDASLNRVVALKVLKSGIGDAAIRLLSEGRAAAQLSHPNIINVYSVGEYDGHLYIAMEYVKGHSLDNDLIDRGVLTSEETVRIGRQVASALAHAHARGIIHRDIKPANVLLERGSGRARVTDFGLAKDLRSGLIETETGIVLGTPVYMPPEQAGGDSCDNRSDIYSLGAMLYEMISGRLPFEAENYRALVRKITNDEPPSLPPYVNQRLSEIIFKCMHKDADKRFQRTEDLEKALAGLERGGVERKSLWRIRRFAVAAVIVILIVAGLARMLWPGTGSSTLSTNTIGALGADKADPKGDSILVEDLEADAVWFAPVSVQAGLKPMIGEDFRDQLRLGARKAGWGLAPTREKARMAVECQLRLTGDILKVEALVNHGSKAISITTEARIDFINEDTFFKNIVAKVIDNIRKELS